MVYHVGVRRKRSFRFMIMNLRDYKTVKDRRAAIEKETGVSLSHIGSSGIDEEAASTKNCENMIGATQVPLGVAGPIKVQSSKFKVSSSYIPLATTEGALVASVNRGCKTITQSGGAAVDSHRVGATRGPVFRVNNLGEHKKLCTFLEKNFQKMQKLAKTTSQHLTLTSYLSRGAGKERYVRFVFDTKDAMGMNMVTIAATALVAFISEQTGIRCVSVAGNYDVDKKSSWLNVIEGRGIQVWAEVTIPEKILSGVLKTTAARMYSVWITKCMMGSAISGSMGCNAQHANILSSLFLATGQDMGHVGEGSLGITTTETVSKDLYVSVHIPDLMVGTIGGGTGLATQKEALSMLGVAGGNDGKNSEKFAEIVGAAVLAGEISLLASLSEGTLARAHERLGRGK